MKTFKQVASSLCVATFLGLTIVSCQKDFEPVSSDGTPISQGKHKLSGTPGYLNSDATAPRKSRHSAARMLVENTTVTNTDYVSTGVGGLRDVGNGTIALSGLSGSVTKAYLYWHGITLLATGSGNSITVNGSPVNGTTIGISGSNCHEEEYGIAYRADVTSLVQSTGNGNYALSGFGTMNPNGASLVVFFNDANLLNNRDVTLFEGNDTNFEFGGPFAGIPGNPEAPADANSWDANFSGINYTSGSVYLQLHVADGQVSPDGAIMIHSTELVPAGSIFEGNSLPGGIYWDIKAYDITSLLSPGSNSLHLSQDANNDCLSLVVALIDAPTETPAVEVMLDFKPGGCPNPFNMTGKGNVPMAILGTDGFDVTSIDVSTIRVNGQAPTGWSVSDVGAPYAGEVTDCSTCSSAKGDGIPDLTLKFSNESITTSLGSVAGGSCVSVSVTGNLLPAFNATSITGLDYIKIVPKK